MTIVAGPPQGNTSGQVSPGGRVSEPHRVRRIPTEAHAFLESLPLVDGIAQAVLWCRTHRLVPVLTSLAWDIVGTHLCSRYHFDRACGPRLEIIHGRYSGQVAEQFDEQAKRDFADSVATHLGVESPITPLFSCRRLAASTGTMNPFFTSMSVSHTL